MGHTYQYKVRLGNCVKGTRGSISQPKPNGDNSTSVSRSWAAQDGLRGTTRDRILPSLPDSGLRSYRLLQNPEFFYRLIMTTFRLMNICYSRSILVL